MNDVLALQKLPTDEGRNAGLADDTQEEHHYPHSHASAHCGFSGLSLLAC